MVKIHFKLALKDIFVNHINKMYHLSINLSSVVMILKNAKTFHIHKYVPLSPKMIPVSVLADSGHSIRLICLSEFGNS